MPLVLTSYNKATGAPVTLLEVDEALCQHTGVPCDPQKWHPAWGNYLQMAIALKEGDIAEVRKAFPAEAFATHAVLDWLDANYTFSGHRE